MTIEISPDVDPALAMKIQRIWISSQPAPEPPPPDPDADLRAEAWSRHYTLEPRKWPKSSFDPLGQGPRDGQSIEDYWVAIVEAERLGLERHLEQLRKAVFG